MMDILHIVVYSALYTWINIIMHTREKINTSIVFLFFHDYGDKDQHIIMVKKI